MKQVLTGLVALLIGTAGGQSEGTGGWGGALGPIVRWDRIEGTFVLPDGTAGTVGPLQGSARYRVAEGKATLNVESGVLNVRVEGLSWNLHYPNAPLGSGLSGSFMGTVVCDSTGRFGTTVWADTPVLEIEQGAASFAGVIDLPEACRDRPNEIVFLLRHAAGPFFGMYVAYGAGRTIR